MNKKQIEKKESKDQLAIQFIQSKYAHSGEVLYLVSAVQVGRISAYAAFDQNGISVYEFNQADNKNMFIVERYEWRDFKKVIVDHYFVKSVFSFEGIKSLTLIVQSKGKELEDVIRRHTEIDVVVLKRAAWRKILGYRSQTNWKMLIASIVYTWLLLAILKAILPEAIHNAITFIGLLGIFLSIVALIVGLFKPKLVLPKMKIKTRKRVAYSYTYLIITCFLVAGVFMKVDTNDTKTLKSASPVASQIDSQQEEADRKAQEEAAAQKAKEEADRKAQEEAAAQKAKEEADRKAQEEAAAQKAKEEADRKAQEEAAALQAKQKAERKAQEEVALKAKQEEERKAQEVAAAQKAEAERKAQEQAAAQAAAQQTAQQQASTSVYYKNCDAVRAAGVAPIHQGEPGYAKHLDRDGDGIACDR